MSEYNFDVVLNTNSYTIDISSTENYGYFEHKELGEDSAGGLWFNNEVQLLEYDGVAVLPAEVKAILIKLGHIKESEYDIF
jgi:hypothetical protein